MVQVLNAVGVDYACFGNHEADVGLKALRKRIGEFSATLINSNVPGAVVDAPATAVVSFPAVHKSNCRGASRVAVGILPPLDSVSTAVISPRAPGSLVDLRTGCRAASASACWAS